MVIIKKLLFGLIFLLSFNLFIYFLDSFWKNYYIILSFSLTDFIYLFSLIGLLITTSLLFIIFITLANSYKLIIPILLFTIISPIILIPSPQNLVMLFGSQISFYLTYLLTQEDLNSYLSFNPSRLLIPHIKFLLTLLILTLSIAYYLGINKLINTQAFQLPDTLINTILELSNQNDSQLTNSTSNIDPSILNQLKSNPQLLQQYGIDPNLLNQNSSSNPDMSLTRVSENRLKNQIKSQINNILLPYTKYIPLIMTVTLFLTLQPLTSVLSIFLFPLVWIVFSVLDRSGYTKYQIEMREVKKLVT